MRKQVTLGLGFALFALLPSTMAHALDYDLQPGATFQATGESAAPMTGSFELMAIAGPCGFVPPPTITPCYQMTGIDFFSGITSIQSGPIAPAQLPPPIDANLWFEASGALSIARVILSRELVEAGVFDATRDFVDFVTLEFSQIGPNSGSYAAPGDPFPNMLQMAFALVERRHRVVVDADPSDGNDIAPFIFSQTVTALGTLGFDAASADAPEPSVLALFVLTLASLRGIRSPRRGVSGR